MNQLASVINLQGLSWDILALIFLFVVAFLYGMLLGKNRIILIMLSTYISFAIVSVFPFSYIGNSNIFFAKIVVFMLFIILSFLFLNRSFFGHLFKISKALSNISFVKITVLSFFQIGLFMSVFFTLVESENIASLASMTKLIFVTEISQVVWFVLPVLLLGVFKGRKNI